ncbi:MAG: hypothetical protein IPF38_15290 [Burkholderiales bacterium]|nr:hypothetical protein [Burkholderiales bacterium]
MAAGFAAALTAGFAALAAVLTVGVAAAFAAGFFAVAMVLISCFIEPALMLCEQHIVARFVLQSPR